MDKKMKVGIIGAGRIGRVHAMSISNYIPEVEIKAVSDIYYPSAEKLAKDLGIPNSYENYQEIINDPEIDAVLVCSSTDTHAQISIEAANMKKHVFCEKPVDLSVEKVEAVLKAVEENGVKLQIGFNRRFDHNFRKVKELIKSGDLGDLHIVKITSRDPEPPNPEYVAVSGGMFMDMTIHDFDMARFLVDSEVEEVYVAAACRVDEKIGEAGDVDTAVITLRFKNGTLCVIDNSRKAVYGYDQRVEVFGSKGKAEVANDTPSTATWSTADGVFGEKPKYFFLERYMESFATEIKEFVDAIINDKETPVTGIDGLKPILIGLAAKESVKEGRPVKL
ncbi:inositol 2-dehydrogenase [Anaeromicrobium sediminis]|uniref:Inositol 2-dehydrogenase n=1 Tax=Anaeromicrobium sediminis TaxID=1478221 RepID=A0A267MFC9_9FIRM|nr:inositol 2-dehydrogenase [Anaeromicrobium sediminis]PAB58246.1 inositol 2-dehydrogenase [Anaeromicrobium sediminis]